MTDTTTQRICAFEECTEPAYRTRSWCNRHYMQRYRNGRMGLAKGPTPYRNPTGICEVKDCDHASRHGGRWCSKHQARVRRHGDTSVVKTPTLHYGPANSSWVGDEVGYSGQHERVRRRYGPASDYGCAHGCGRQAQHWAYDHGDQRERQSVRGPYSARVEHYVPLCVSCHKLMDLAR